MKRLSQIVVLVATALSASAWADPDRDESGHYWADQGHWSRYFEAEREARKRHEESERERQKRREEAWRERRKYHEELERESLKHALEMEREGRGYYYIDHGWRGL